MTATYCPTCQHFGHAEGCPEIEREREARERGRRAADVMPMTPKDPRDGESYYDPEPEWRMR